MMKWLHPVVTRSDFLTEWGASWEAFLSQPAVDTLYHRPVAFPEPETPSLSCHRFSTTETCTVGFQDLVEICVIDENFESNCFNMTHSQIENWTAKPWGLDLQASFTDQNSAFASLDPSAPIEQAYSTSSSSHQRSHRDPRTSRAALHSLQYFRGWTPPWAQVLWDQVFVRQAHTWNSRQGPTIEVKTWLLNDDHLQICTGFRTIELDENSADWYYELRKKWMDQLNPNHDFEVFMVYPEPPRGTHSVEMHVAHLILSQIQSDRKAAMITAVINYGERYTNRMWRAAVNTKHTLTHDEVMDIVPDNFKRTADPDRFTVFHEERLFGQVPLPIHDGTGIVAYLESRLDIVTAPPAFPGLPQAVNLQDILNFAPPEVPDFTALLAMGPPQFLGRATRDAVVDDPNIVHDDVQGPDLHDNQDVHSERSDSPDFDDEPPWHSSITYALSVPASTGRTDWTNHDTLHRSIAANLAVSHHDLQTFYSVQAAPEDLADHYTQTFVALLRWDILPGERQRLILLDVEFYNHGPLKQPEVVREARLLPVQFTRTQLFHFLGLRRYCEQTAPQGCLFWINGQIQLTQFSGFIHIDNGDFLRIALPPSEDLDDTIATRQAAASCHKGNSIDDTIIWHHTTGLDPEDSTLLPLAHPGNDDVFHLMQTDVRHFQIQYEFDPMTPWRNHIHDAWRHQLQQFGQHARLKVATFLLDHQNIFRQDEAKIVDLSVDFQEWKTQITQAWQDHLTLPDVQIDFVFPSPMTMSRSITAYVVLTQHCDPTKASILMSVFDPAIDGWTECTFALVVPRLTMKAHLIEYSGLHRTCLPRGSRRCTLQHVDTVLHDDVVLPIDMGMGLSLEVHRHSEDSSCERNTDPTSNTDEIGFLQEALHLRFQHLGAALQAKAYENWLNTCSLEDSPPFQNLRIPEDPGPAILEIVRQNEMQQFARQDALTLLRGHVPVVLQHVFDYLHDVTAHDPVHDEQFTIMTWYLNSDSAWRCNIPRPVPLPQDVTQWQQAVRSAWEAEWDDSVDYAFHLAFPAIWDIEAGVQAHVIVLQHALPNIAGVLIAVYDNALSPTTAHRFAVSHEGTISHTDVLHHADRDLVCMGSGASCSVWFSWDQLLPQDYMRPISGFVFNLMVQRPNVLPADPHAWDNFQQDNEEATSLLQTRTKLVLSELLDFEADAHKVVFLLQGTPIPLLPPWIEISNFWSSESIVKELKCWGHTCQVYELSRHDTVLCFPVDFCFRDAWHHFVYVHEDLRDREGIILHSAKSAFTSKDHMKFLRTRGYPKAVIVSADLMPVGVTRVRFIVSQGEIESVQLKKKTLAPWPAPQQPTSASHQQLLPTPWLNHPDCLLRSPVSYDEVQALLCSSQDVLCTSFADLNLPPSCQQAFQWCGLGLSSTIDRLLIYTDGSSPGGSRLTPPEKPKNGEPQFDTWAMLVIGETYVPDIGQPKFHLVGWMAHPVLYDPESAQHLFADRLGSDIAEREALFFAGLWRLGFSSNLPTVFRPDSLSTCLQASGQCGTAQPGSAYRALRGVYQALSAMLPGDSLQFAHVTSHMEEPFNEFVDFAAKQEREKSFYHDRQPVDFHKWLPVLPYVWMYLDQQAGLPPVHMHGFVAEAPDLPRDSCASYGQDTVSPTMELPLTWECSLAVGTANVGSLSVGPEGHGGKLAYLRQQFTSHKIHLLGIQESRAPTCSSLVDGVFRLASGSDTGHFGVELWVNTTCPFATCGDTSHYFQPSDFTVVVSFPRHMLIHVENHLCHAWILVAHAPQSGRSVSDRELWWHDVANCLQEHCSDDPLIVLLDANASVGGSDGVHVFTHDSVSSSTRFLRDFLEQFALCLPSTGQKHQGSDVTWRSPDGLIEKRIDFVAVPTSWCSRVQSSYVLPQFDLGHVFDHVAVQLNLTWQEQADLPSKRSGLPQYDRVKIAQDPVRAGLASLEIPSWSSDIEHHVQTQNAQYHSVLSAHCGINRQKAKKSFLTEDIWALRSKKLLAKKQVHKIGSRLRKELLRTRFSVWRSDPTFDSVVPGCTAFEDSLRCKRLWWSAELLVQSKMLRTKLKTARLDSLSSAVSALPPFASASSVLQVVKSHQGTTNLAKLKPKALPQVKAADGSVCTTQNASLNRWIEYFMTMEGGSRVSADEQRSTWRKHLEEFCEPFFDESLLAIPTLTDVEIALRRVSKNKAAGPDGLPGELCRSHPQVLARHLYSQILKLALHGQESLEHKGGFLSFLYKGKGDHQECSAYRSILVSSHLGKCLHRAVRSHQQTLYETFLQRQQVGGRRSVPVSLGLHIVRGFMRLQKARKRSAGVCFLDLREAFYRIIRPLAVNISITDEEIAAIFQRFGLPPTVMDDLREVLRQPSAVAQAGLPWFAQKYVSALHMDIHFSLKGQMDQCRTTVGSRPGDSFADVVFGYTFARVLKTLESQLVAHNLLDHFASPTTLEPFDPPSDASVVPLLGAVWMDDLAVCISADSAQALESKIGVACSCLLDLCYQFGMSPNLARGKTELLLAFAGPGSRSLKLKYYGPSYGNQMPIVGERGVSSIAVVQTYTHLGNVVHIHSHCKNECRRRVAIGQTAFNQHRRLLFQSQHLTLQIRRQLFDTLVLSKVLYGTEVWLLQDKTSIHYFHSAVMRLYRRLSKIPHDAHIPDDEILSDLGVPAPSTLLRRQRLRYMVTLFRCEHSAPFGLIQADSGWMEQLREDLNWMYAQLAKSSPLPDPGQDFARWRFILTSHPNYWKKLVNRAVRHEVLQRQNGFQVTQFHHRVHDIITQAGDTLPLPGNCHAPEPQCHFGS